MCLCVGLCVVMVLVGVVINGLVQYGNLIGLHLDRSWLSVGYT